MGHFVETGAPVNLAATGVISETPGALLGVYVNSTSSGVITFSSGGASGATTGGTALCGSITPAIGFLRFPAQTPDRLYMTLVSGSINVTAFFAAG